jgi:hypothetical protein
MGVSRIRTTAPITGMRIMAMAMDMATSTPIRAIAASAWPSG